MTDTPNRACISYWFPRIEGLPGVPTPKTRIVETDVDLLAVCDGQIPKGFYRFLAKLEEAATSVSKTGPWFLRTGVFSGKHSWKDTCYLTSTIDIPEHVAQIVEMSHTVDLYGLPTNVWAVREFIPLDIHFRAFRGNMPIATEARVFFRNGHVTCVHPYWPIDAFETRLSENMTAVDDRIVGHVESMDQKVRADEAHLVVTTRELVAPRFGDEWWSVDWACGDDGRWWLTDMAPGERSWHPGCPWGNHVTRSRRATSDGDMK
jgi:hypothetical protein